MKLSPALHKAYTKERLSAHEAQLRAQFIAWGPAIFQTARIMLKYGILEMLRESENGLTYDEICRKTELGEYAVKCLLEASLCMGTVLIAPETSRYTLSKTGWFLLIDSATKADIDFNHDVNYEGWFYLEESFLHGKPEGLRHFGDWATVYEGLSCLPEHVQKSWFGFDHFYSDHSFDQALEIVFGVCKPRVLFDVGGNTGRWALRCVGHDPDVRVVILDLPQQIDMMRRQIQGKTGAERIDGYGINLLDSAQHFPLNRNVDAIWMSQFLDCFSMEQIVAILQRAAKAMTQDTRLYIMETLWDRQKYEPAALALTMTSLYFTAIANGNSKMYNTEDLQRCIESAGLVVEQIHDGLGHGHSILVCKLK
ncbi:methyltransferase [Phocaeicola sartorii]|uniref:methyltransferase n=1 Tax=Phocaeicola sartorii TaxID=671267 RepID=UPI0025932C6E|nr:methyltransferase [Phocaeicola sartorii]